MRDPKPENIRGQKRHVVKWQVDVGQVALGLAALAAIWFVYSLFVQENTQEEDTRHQEVAR